MCSAIDGTTKTIYACDTQIYIPNTAPSKAAIDQSQRPHRNLKHLKVMSPTIITTTIESQSLMHTTKAINATLWNTA